MNVKDMKPGGVYEIHLNIPEDKRESARYCQHVEDADGFFGTCKKHGGQCFLDGRRCDNGNGVIIQGVR